MKKKLSVLYLAVALMLMTVLNPFAIKAETMLDRIETTLEINQFYSFQKEYSQRMYYDIELSKSGTLKLDFSYGYDQGGMGIGLSLCVFDIKGNIIIQEDVNPMGYAELGLDEGKYIIEVKQNVNGAGNYNAKFYLSFSEKEEDILQMTITLKKGDSIELGAIVTPSSDSSNYTWKSSNSKIATVSKKGIVQAKKKGKTVIMVTTSTKYSSELNSTIIIKVK